VLFNPEFLTEVTADQDMSYPDRQIVGYTKQSYTVAQDVLHLLPLAPFERIIPATEAEMVTYYGNTWFAVKVSFANEMYDVCKKLGIEYDRVMECAAADKRIGRTHLEVWHKGYRGYGGKCLPKDMKAFIAFARSLGIALPVHEAAEKVNERLRRLQGISDEPPSSAPL
jgi:UDPglucose 6-dehydrogenase